MTSCCTGSAASWRASSVLRTGPAVAPSTAASTGTADVRRDFLLSGVEFVVADDHRAQSGSA
jgi:hypothetical protein